MAEDGFIYERKCIESWLRQRRTSPHTNRPMGVRLLDAVNIRNAIEQLVRSNVLPEAYGADWKEYILDTDQVRSLSQAMDSGDASAAFQLGRLYEKGATCLSTDPDRMLQCYMKAARKGHNQAMCALAHAFEAGSGTFQNDAMVIYWLMEAAKQHSAIAMVRLGRIFKNGLCSVPVDEELAVHWFMQAVEENDPLGFFEIAKCYASGQGVEKNVQRPIDYFEMARPHCKGAALLDKYKP